MITLSMILAFAGFGLVGNGFPVTGAALIAGAFYLLGRTHQLDRMRQPRFRACDVSIDDMDMIARRVDGHAALASRLMRRARVLLNDLSAGRDPSRAAQRLNGALTEAERRSGKKDTHHQ